MTTKVKICGLTNLDDAMDAVELGADFLGFIFYPESPRHVTLEAFAEIALEIPSEICKVGVFVNADPLFVVDMATEYDLRLLQFHGDETPEYCRQFARPYMKAFRPRNESDLAVIPTYEGEFVLVDSFVESVYGGTGITGNWDLARAAKAHGNLFLSGGLTPANVEIAIHAVKPFAVDVASGVESMPGRKDYRKMEEFIARAKGGAA